MGTVNSTLMQTGQIWLVDSDHEDQDIVREVLEELGQANELVFPFTDFLLRKAALKI